MMGVKITETVLRDGHQSLIATRMKTEDMLPIAEKLDEVGYFSLEMWGGATFDVSLRYLNENPWERIRVLRKKIKNTNLQMLLRGQNLVGYRHYPDDIVIKFIEHSAKCGIDIFRIFDALNDVRNMELSIKIVKKCEKIAEGAICYTISPVHTISQYVALGKKLKELGCDIICIKDMAGFISPKDAYELTLALKKEVGLPVHLHSHCSSGMAPVSYLFACQAGVDILDTAISPFGWGTSQPPTESMVASLKNTPYDTGLDLQLLSEICEYFRKVKQKYTTSSISEGVDPSVVIHQIPGGMLSNLISQLKEQNAMDKYYDVLKEVPIVRKELGYPPLVTPTSQIVGTQAVWNVLTGKRYKIIPKEVKDYIRALYGRPPGEIDSRVQKIAIGDETPITCRPADLLKPEYEKCVETMKKYSLSEDYILAYALFPQITIQLFEKKKEKKEEKEEEKEEKKEIEIVREGNENLIISVDDKKYEVMVNKFQPTGLFFPLRIIINSREYDVKVFRETTQVAKKSSVEKQPISGGITVRAPMPGRVVDIKVNVGDPIKKGDLLLILESMKMENEITSDIEGIVKEINVKKGENVEGGVPLVRIET